MAVMTELSMSLDGFVAGPNDSPTLPLGEGGRALFAWYQSGTTALALPGTDMVFQVDPASAAFVQPVWANIGAMVAGRRMFDIANAWAGRPPVDGPCFVVSHRAAPEWQKPPFVFVNDGVASAIAQAQQAAAGRNVSLSSASVVQQALRAGLLDEIFIDLAPVLLGGGVRLFEQLGGPIALEPIAALATPHVMHLHVRVKRETEGA